MFTSHPVFLDVVVTWRWVMVTIAASHAWAVSTLRWRSWMNLLIVDTHLGVADQVPLPRNKLNRVRFPSVIQSY